jgi:DNA-binding NtrC family response regulator
MATTEIFRPIPESFSETREAAAAADACRLVLLGDGTAVRQLRSQIQRIAPYFRIAVIRGEAGAGKSVVARSIHAHSSGALGPFIEADAADFASAVASALQPRSAPSLLELAQGGTLYLTGTSELTAAQQDAIMRFFRDRWERRTPRSAADNGKTERRESSPGRLRYSGMRILASSERDLRTMASVGQFRQDLYVQLSAVEMVVPPLRERLEDIPVLATWLLRRLEVQTRSGTKHFSQAALTELRERQWPGNLCELEEVVAQAAVQTQGNLIEPAALGKGAAIRPAPAAPPRIDRLSEVVQRHVLEVLMRCEGNKLRAAELLGISRSTLYRMLDSNVDAMSAFSS